MRQPHAMNKSCVIDSTRAPWPIKAAAATGLLAARHLAQLGRLNNLLYSVHLAGLVTLRTHSSYTHGVALVSGVDDGHQGATAKVPMGPEIRSRIISNGHFETHRWKPLETVSGSYGRGWVLLPVCAPFGPPGVFRSCQVTTKLRDASYDAHGEWSTSL